MKKGLLIMVVFALVLTSSLVLAEDIVINFAGDSVGGQGFKLTQEAIEEYEAANPGVEINNIESPQQVQDRLALYLQYLNAESSEIDIFLVDVIWPGDLGEHFIDLNQYGLKEAAKGHFPGIVENNTVDGRLVAMPFFTDAPLLFYRKDLLEKYDFDVPETWGELKTTASYIQTQEWENGNKDINGFVWQGNAYEGLTCDALEWIASNGGGTIISPDKKITINNDKAVEALEMAANWVGTISPEAVTGFAEEDARYAFQGGNAVFMRNWPYCYSLARDAEDSAVKSKFGVAPLPAGDSGHTAGALGGWQLSVSKYSEHKEVAADFVKFLTSKKNQKFRAVEGSYHPTIQSLYEDADVREALPYIAQLGEVFDNISARPSTATAPNYNEVSTLFFQAVHSVLTGDEDARTALEYLELDLVDLTGFEIGEPRN